MRIKQGFVLRQVADATIVVPSGKTAIDFNGMITLNDTGAFLWKQMENETTPEQVLEAMLREYDVDEATAKAGVAKFMGKLKDAGLLE